MQNKPLAVGAALVTLLKRPVEFVISFQEVEVIVIWKCHE